MRSSSSPSLRSWLHRAIGIVAVALIPAIAPPVPAAASSESATELGIAGLAATITTTISEWFPVVAGRITAVEGSHAVVDLAGLETGRRLEWLTVDAEFTHPTSLALAGTVLRSCGSLVIERSSDRQSHGTWTAVDCSRPSVGDPVRSPPYPLELAIVAGQVEPGLAGLVDLLAAVVPSRLERTGRFEAPAGGRRSTTAVGTDSAPKAAAPRPDAVVALNAARRDGRLVVLVELTATHPRERREIAQIEIASPPEALWRNRQSGAGSPYGDASTAVRGPILALAQLPSDGGQPSIAVLTGDELFAARVTDDGSIALESLADLRRLPRLVSRSPAGTIVVTGDRAAPAVCFAATVLRSGWCLPLNGPPGGPLREFAGVPFTTRSHELLVAVYVDESNLLSGVLRDGAGRDLADIGPFLALAPAAGGGIRVRRPDGRLEHLTDNFQPTTGPSAISGDAWAESGPALRVESSPRAWGAPDAITLSRAGLEIERRPVSGDVTGLLLVERAGGPTALAVATSDRGGPSRLSLFALPY